MVDWKADCWDEMLVWIKVAVMVVAMVEQMDHTKVASME